MHTKVEPNSIAERITVCWPIDSVPRSLAAKCQLIYASCGLAEPFGGSSSRCLSVATLPESGPQQHASATGRLKPDIKCRIFDFVWVSFKVSVALPIEGPFSCLQEMHASLRVTNTSSSLILPLIYTSLLYRLAQPPFTTSFTAFNEDTSWICATSYD